MYNITIDMNKLIIKEIVNIIKVISSGILAVGILLTNPCISSANRIQDRIIVSVSVGAGFYALDDVNQLIEEQNGLFLPSVPDELNPGTIKNGVNWHLEMAYCPHPFIIVGVDGGALYANAKGRAGSVLIDASYYEIDLMASEIGGFVKAAYFIGPDAFLTLGFGFYNVALFGSREKADDRGFFGILLTSDSIPYSGNTLGQKLMLGLDFIVWDSFSLYIETGYRLAKISKVEGEINGNTKTLVMPNGQDFSIDFTGPFVKGGFRIIF
jgi:hypothetical protein